MFLLLYFIQAYARVGSLVEKTKKKELLKTSRVNGRNMSKNLLDRDSSFRLLLF